MTAPHDRGVPEAIGSRVRWTKEHLERLDRICDGVAVGDTYEITRKVNRDAMQHTYYFTQLRPLPEDIALIVGDVVHNMRSVLDHVAFHAVTESRSRLTQEDKRQVTFVIADSAELFSHQQKRRGSAMGEVLTRIEAFQPYRGPRTYQNAHLAYLRDLSNTDKHRRLNIAVHVMEGFDLEQWTGGDRLRSASWFDGPLVNGAMALVAAFRSPQPEVDLSEAVKVRVGIGESLPRGLANSVVVSASERLRTTLRYIEDEVIPGVLGR